MTRRTLDRSGRSGSALLTTILLTLVVGTLVTGAIYAASNATLLTTSFDREREFKYASEAALAMGKSRLNNDPLALPDSNFATLISNGGLTGADGQPLRGVTVNLYVGPTGSTSGQFGRFASVVAEARDVNGARSVRRLELAQESFAKYAYWSNHETNNGQTIVFANGDNLWGPVWSNESLTIHSTGATFHGDVGTAGSIVGASYGTFVKGYSINQPRINLPTSVSLAALQGYAAAGSSSFTAPTSGDETSVRMRIEFVAIDLNADGDSTDADEGFFKVYTADLGYHNWMRGDWNGTKNLATNCGATYPVTPGGPRKFFPLSVHGQAWFRTLLQNGGMTAAQAADTSAASLTTIMRKSTARCYLGGDPQLVAEERNSAGFSNADKQKGGDDTTFTAVGAKGSWMAWPGAVDPRIANTRYKAQAGYLFPLYRGLNPGTKGVIYVSGTVGVSGVVRGKVTLMGTRIVTILDDLRYATDPAGRRCGDIFGIIASQDIVVSDNALLDPPDIDPTSGTTYKNLDDTKDLYVHGVMMALSTSFTVQAYNLGSTNANGCEGQQVGRGCLYLTGGLIQDSRGPVGTTGGTGYTKRYSYDTCAASNPPPYFPTTGRFTDNRYYEIDPVRFDVASLFRALTPN
jgi:hypothetical protein